MGNVIILPETTKDPISMIGRRAGICYNADITDANANYKRGLDCIKANHGRALEFPDVHMVLEGFSAKVIREWYTHIGGSPSRLQESTRYIDYTKFDYVIPDDIKADDGALRIYLDTMAYIATSMKRLYNNYGINKEDVSMLLPFGMVTKVVDKRNARNLIDMSRNRECKRAFWEYRDGLFPAIKKSLSEYSDEWSQFISLTFYPKCEMLGYCPENNSCGRKSKYRRVVEDE